MWWVLALGYALATEPAEVTAGTLGAVGDRLSSGQITRVVMHPEFERYWLVGDSGEMVAELTRDDGVHQGLCSVAGRTLFPRPELVEGKVGRIALEPLCGRMTAGVVGAPAAAQAPEAAGQAPEAVGVVAPGGTVFPGRGGLAGLAVVALLLATHLSRTRRILLAGSFVAGLVVRITLTTPTLFNGGDAGYEKLRVALRLTRNEGWGPAYGLWMRPAVEFFGPRPEAVFWTNLLFACAWPALVAWCVDRLVGRREAWAAAMVGAALPVHVAISWSEAMHVSAVTWATLALVGAVELRRGERAGALLMATAGICAIATRADLGGLALVLPFWLWGLPRGERWLGGAALGAIVAVTVGVAGDGRALVQDVDLGALSALLVPRFGVPAGASGFFVWAHAGFTPWLWWALAALGLSVAGLRREAITLVVLAAAPLVFKVSPLPDAMRLQLLAQGGLVMLVAVGLVRAGRWGWLVLGCGVLLGPPLSGPAWRHREEWKFLAGVVPTLPADAVVGVSARGEAFRDVMQALGPARWTGGDGATHVYRAPGDPRVDGAVVAEEELGGTDVDGRGSAGRTAVAGIYVIGR